MEVLASFQIDCPKKHANIPPSLMLQMTKGYWFLLCFFLFTTTAKAQLDDFNVVLHQDGALGIGFIYETPDNGYLIGGRYLVSSPRNYDNFLVKYNDKLDQVWSKRIGSDDEEWLHGSAMDSKGNLYLSTTSRSWGGAQGRVGSNLMKLDTLGNLVWARSVAFPLSISVQMREFSLVGDSLLVLSGFSSSADTTSDGSAFLGNQYFNQISVVSMTTDGDLNFHKVIEPLYETDTRHSITADGGILLFSSAFEDSGDEQSDTAREYVTKLALDGSIEWSKEYIIQGAEHQRLNFRSRPLNIEGKQFLTTMKMQPSLSITKTYLGSLSIDAENDGALLQAFTLETINGYTMNFIDQSHRNAQPIDSVIFRLRINNDFPSDFIISMVKTDAAFSDFEYYSYEDNGEAYYGFLPDAEGDGMLFTGFTFNDAKDLAGDGLWGKIDKGLEDCRIKKLGQELLIKKDITSNVLVKNSVLKSYLVDTIIEFTPEIYEDLSMDYSVRTCQELSTLSNNDTIKRDTIKVCPKDELNFTASNDLKYEWFGASKSSNILETNKNYSFLFEEELDLVIQGYSGRDTLYLRTKNNCPVPEECVIYRKFSPNGDGLNDCFKIKGLENFEENLVVIYNELGQEVFREENYKNGTYCFDDLNDGSYSLYVNLSGKGEFYESILIKR